MAWSPGGRCRASRRDLQRAARRLRAAGCKPRPRARTVDGSGFSAHIYDYVTWENCAYHALNLNALMTRRSNRRVLQPPLSGDAMLDTGQYYGQPGYYPEWQAAGVARGNAQAPVLSRPEAIRLYEVNLAAYHEAVRRRERQ